MVLLSACRLTNIEMLQKVMGHHLGYPEIFLVAQKYFTIREEKKFIRKIPVDDIVFKLKSFSYIKTHFSITFFQVLKLKLHLKLQKMF